MRLVNYLQEQKPAITNISEAVAAAEQKQILTEMPFLAAAAPWAIALIGAALGTVTSTVISTTANATITVGSAAAAGILSYIIIPFAGKIIEVVFNFMSRVFGFKRTKEGAEIPDKSIILRPEVRNEQLVLVLTKEGEEVLEEVIDFNQNLDKNARRITGSLKSVMQGFAS